MPEEYELDAVRPSALRSFVRRFRTEILAEWRRAARELPIARDLNAVTLVDHIPDLLDEIAELAGEIAAGQPAHSAFETARRHALDRLSEGFDITTVVNELSLLRGAVLTVWSRNNFDRSVAELRALDLAIDRAIAASVGRYAEAHERTLAGIDRISTASFEASSVDELMQRLLAVFIETTPAVDTAAIVLVEGERLHVRAAVGLEEELERGASVAFGQGFAGTIAARREPMELRSAYLHPLVNSDVIRKKRVHALYGVPLIQNDKVIGVAHMGSITAHEFSQEDRQFFGSMAARATLGIAHHMLRHELAASEERFKSIAAEREGALAKLESLLAASPIAIAFVDRDLRYLRVNEALAQLSDRPAVEHIGRTVSEVHPAAAAKLEPLLRRVLDTGRPVLNLEMTRPPSGDTQQALSLLANYFPIRAPSGEIMGVGGIVIDVTEVKQIEHELRVAVRTREDVLAIVSHDLRSPLGTVQLGATTLMGQLAGDQRARRHLEMIHRSCTRMENLIDDLLDTASIREGRLQLDVQREPADEVLAEAVDLQQSLAEEQGIALARSYEVETIDILCDRDRILQVFGNLIGNAIKFCRPGDTITVTCKRAGDHVVFSVTDTGPGIGVETLPHLFDPYWSGADHVKRGSGLGLYISRGIVERHGGKIWVESTHGAGSSFLFTLPIAS